MSNDEGTIAEDPTSETEASDATEAVAEENGENNDDEEEEEEADNERSSGRILKDVEEDRNVSSQQSLVVLRGLPVVSPSVATIVRQEELDSKREVVKFASRFTAIAYPPLQDVSRMLKPISDDDTSGAWRKYMQLDTVLTLSEALALAQKDHVTQFTQTFFKALTKVTNRRLIEILNMNINYEDISLVFYCTSHELITDSRGSEEELETESLE